MNLRITLLLGEANTVRNLVFSILIHEYPLKIIQLTNLIKKRYGKNVTFQAVRKAILELVEEEVLEKKDKRFSINKNWIRESKKTIDEIYQTIYQEKAQPKKIDSIGEEISVFSFNSLNEMMKFWQNLIEDWFRKFKPGDPKINCFQGSHGWEGLLHPDTERNLMGQLKDKGIKSYVLFTSNTILDKILINFYKSMGIKTLISKSLSQFDRSYYVATYGDLVVQTQYPKNLIENLDKFFKKNKKLKDLNLKELSDIVNKKIEMKLSVNKNINMAKKINQSILGEFS